VNGSPHRLATDGSTGAVQAERSGSRPTDPREHRSDASTVTPNWPRVSKLDLGPLLTAIGCARDHARHVLAEWGLGHLADDAILLVSELMTNAVTASRALPAPAPVALRLLANDRQLIIEAWDQQVDGYDLKRAAPDDEHGRGLTVVARLSKRWGVGRIQDTYKVIWCELEVTTPQARKDPP
jgi:anti-sigma regulatory factor (Ser/Thr protein kinase)